MTIRNTLYFTYGGYDWSESYWDMDNTAVSQSASVVKSQALADARSNLMGNGVLLKVVRQSVDGVKRQTWDVYNSPDIKANTPWKPALSTIVASNQQGAGDSPILSLKTRFDFPTKGFAIKSMAGFPDSSFTGPRNFDFGGFFSSNVNIAGYWDTFAQLIIGGGWGIRVRDMTFAAQRKLLTAVAFVAGTNYVTVQYASSLGVDVGDYVQLRGVVGDRPFSKINGIYKVSALITGGLNLTPAKRAPAGWTYATSGTIEKVVYTYSSIYAIRPLYVSGHKRGNRGFQEAHGKSKGKT